MLKKKFFIVVPLFLLTSCAGHKKVISQKALDDVVEARFANSVQDRVFFALDKSDLSSDSKSVLTQQAAWINKHSNANIVVEGHADERGTREYNLALGERRANNAKGYLVAGGVDSQQISIISFGKEKPAVIGHDEEAWSQNRRAVTVIGDK